MIRKLVEEGKIDEAIKVLARLHDSLDTDNNTLTLLQSRLAELDYGRTNNLADDNVLRIERNKIVDSFLNFFENLEERVNSVFGLKYDVSNFEQQVKLKMMRHYEDMEVLGEGSSAVIFKAKEKTTEKLVAIRALKSIGQSSSEKEKWKKATQPYNEDGKVSTKLAAQIKHRNIIEILASHEDDIPFCLVLEYINGVTLDHLLKVGYFPMRDTIAIIRQICDALYYLQNLSYNHKNLRPSKIIIDHELKPVISVFEIFKDMRGYSRLDKILDDLRYSSPEELLIDSELLDFDKVNQFLMGLLMFEMLTGTPLFNGDNAELVMESRKAFFEKPAHRKALFKSANLPNDLMKILQRMLEYEPGNRFRNLIDLDKELYKLPLESSEEIELVHESYMRCCAKNREFITSFYSRLFDTYKEKQYEARFEEGRSHRHTHKKLRVMILQLIDMDNGHHHHDLARIKQFKGHDGLAKTDYANFLDTLRKEVEANDVFWQRDPAIGTAWDKVFSRALEKL
ncbi:MAG: protein kinase [Saprospiraceae bacterium]|nr:protein kinase [Saprospiraceae bacterium]